MKSTEQNVMPTGKSPESQTGAQVRGTVENKATKPAGLLPKNTQQLVILSVAVVMVLVMWLTAGPKKVTTSPSAPPAGPHVQPASTAIVEDFKQNIQQEQAATRQPISEANLARLQALALAGDVPPGGVVAPPGGATPEPGGVIGGGATGAEPATDSIRQEKKKREYLSLFSGNVAFTSRKAQDAEALARTSTSNGPPKEDTPQLPSAADLDSQVRQNEAALVAAAEAGEREAQTAQSPVIAGQKPPLVQRLSPDQSQSGAFNSFRGTRYVLFEGTILETLLINRLNGTFAGPVSCLLTTDIYSHDQQHVLIPAGTKVFGEAKKVEGLGQQRLAVFFHRLVMPDGYSLNLDQFKGLSATGETALRDRVNNHYLQIFGSSLAVGILGGIAEAGTGSVLTASPVDRARDGLGSSLGNSGTEILDRFLNVLPTVAIREGSRVKIYLSGDLLLPDYAQHAMRPDL